MKNTIQAIFLFVFIIKGNAQTLDTSQSTRIDHLIKQSMTQVQKNDFEFAIQIGNNAIDSAEILFGKESVEYANSIFNMGRILRFKGDLVQSEKFYIDAMQLREKLFGKEHSDYAQSLFNLAALYLLKNDLVKAEEYYKLSLDIRKRVLGNDHPDILYNLTGLTDLFYRKGLYQEGLIYIEEALSIKERKFGLTHPAYASSLIWRGLLKIGLGKNDEGIKDYLLAKSIFESTSGKSDPEYANCLNNLAIAYYQIGEISKIEPILNETIEIKKKNLGEKNPATIRSIANLAIFLLELGNYKKAEPLLLQVRTGLQETLGSLHPDYARCLNNLAGLYNMQEKYDKVLPLYLEQLEIQSKTIGNQHPDYAISLNNLGLLYMNMRDYIKAEEFLTNALEIRKNALGEKHFEYAFTLRTLGRLYSLEKKYDKAELFLNDAEQILSTVLGKENHEYLLSLYNLALLKIAIGDSKNAQMILAQMAEINQKLLKNAIYFLSEEELGQYQKTFEKGQREIYKLADHLKLEEAPIHALAYDQALFEKGFLLQARDRLRRISLLNPGFAEQYEIFKKLKNKLSVEYSKPENSRNFNWIDSISLKINELEKSMARQSVDYGKSIQQISWKDVARHLSDQEIAIEFISYKENPEDTLSENKFAALMLKNGDAFPKFISLFSQSALDSLLILNQERKNEYVNALYSLSNRGATAIKDNKRSLYEILWKPMEMELKGIHKIYFSLSGLLHRINLDAIPVNNTETLADQYILVRLSSTRQLVFDELTDSTNNKAYVFGGIKYDINSSDTLFKQLLAARSSENSKENSAEGPVEIWEYLPGTFKESNSVGSYLSKAGMDVHAYQNWEASELTFKKMGSSKFSDQSESPRVIHLATHGYFFSDKSETQKLNTSDVNFGSGAAFKFNKQPMMRSGLIMAGGNASWQGLEIPEGLEDGILTAYEISQMNLSNTELVALSACETGLGDIHGNEGVYGLQRAFKIAGAKYLIMSLWQVPDKQTSLLMTTFYKKWLEEKLSIPEAFRASQRQMREMGLDPYQWAGFVLVE